MTDSAEILVTIDILADLSADVTALRSWLARVHAGYQLSPRERAAIARHLTAMREGTAAVMHGARLIGLHPEDDSQAAAGKPRAGV